MVIQLTLSTEDAETILNAAGIYLPDPETAAGANTVIQLYGYRNDLQNYSEEDMVQTGYWTFKERYGGDIEYIDDCMIFESDEGLRLPVNKPVYIGSAVDVSSHMKLIYEAHIRGDEIPCCLIINAMFSQIAGIIAKSESSGMPPRRQADTAEE